MPRLAAQPAHGQDLDLDAAHGAHFAGAGLDAHADAKLLIHALLHMAQVLQAGDLFEPLQQAFFLFPGEPQDALVGHGVGEQGVVLADAGARRAGDSDRNLNGKAHRCPRKIRPGRGGAGHASSRLQRGQGESPGRARCLRLLPLPPPVCTRLRRGGSGVASLPKDRLASSSDSP